MHFKQRIQIRRSMKPSQSIVMSFLFIAIFLYHHPSVKAETFESQNERVTLIELYTSEGCSSCPPAEAWLNSLKTQQGLWKDFIPLAFHVAYWDYLGWKDHMGSVQNANRQREYAANWGSGTVYTPGVIKNGREWKNWRRQVAIPQENISAGKLLLEWLSDGEVRLQYDGEESRGKLIGHVALIGFGIETNVSRGENRGKILEHDFVVLKHVKQPMQHVDGNLTEAMQVLFKDGFSDVKQFGIVGWINSEEDLTPIQATGGFLN
jgi:hypothetical protein